MRRTIPLLVALLALAPASSASAYINLTTGGGFLFDISDTTDYASPGSLSNGTGDAYDTCYQLRVGGTVYDPTGTSSTTLAGRQVQFPAQTLGGVSVRRVVYVPASGGNYARYLEILENTGTTSVSTTVEVFGNLGSDSGTVPTGSSSGDTAVSAADTWFSTDDSSDGSGDPSLAHVFQGESPSVSVTSASLATDNISYSWSVTVPAGSRVVIMHFAVQEMNRAASMTEARRLVELPDDALMGADDYLDEVVNFGVSVPGAPRIRFTSPFEADEGAEILITAMLEDLEGDTYTWSWDLDDDGTFGERAGELTAMIPAGTTDGPDGFRVGVEATDSAGNTATRYRSVRIVNVDPVISSTPPTLVSVGVDMAYQIVVDDPAGALDTPTFSLIAGPPRMSISDGGLVQWVPNESDVTVAGETVLVVVGVDDGDEGTDEQMWEMMVSPNRRPTPPSPSFPVDLVAIVDRTPRLAAQNSEDLDLDPLTYTFELDTVDTFDSPDFLTSGALDETPGFASWQLTEPLDENRLYHWRVKANDGTIDSEWRQAAFYVVRDPSLPPLDAGPRDSGVVLGDGGLIPGIDAGTGSSDGGCSVSPRSDARAPLALLLLGAGVLAVRRKRS